MTKAKNIFLLIGAVLLIIVGTILFLRRDSIPISIKREIEAYKAANAAAKKVAELGHELTIKNIEEEHKEVVKKLETENKAALDKARRNPQKFARMIARAGDSQ